MRKRVSRHRRFAAVDFGAIDGLSSILAIGLLTCLIRARDGSVVTVASFASVYAEGRAALEKAMRLLVSGGYVVKFKVQCAASEVVEESGERVTRRGGSWWTTFTVDSTPFTREDVAEMLEEIYAEGNVRAVRVEPAHLDPRKFGESPSTFPQVRDISAGGTDRRNPAVGPTCGNTDPEGQSETFPQVGPTAAFPTVGRPTVGQAAALNKEGDCSLSTAAREAAPAVVAEAVTGEREQQEGQADKPPASQSTQDIDPGPAPVVPRGAEPSAAAVVDAPAADSSDAAQVLAAYEAALGAPALNGTRTKLLTAAAELLTTRPLWWVIDRARELPKYGVDLGKHAAMSKAPTTKPKPAARPTGLPPRDPAYVPVQRDMAAIHARVRRPSF